MNFKQYSQKKVLKWSILRYYRNLPRDRQTEETGKVVSYVKKHGVSVFPYDFTGKYTPDNIRLWEDEESGLSYILYHGKRLYYKDHHKKHSARKYFNSLLMEQDPDSPHRYLDDDFRINKGDVVVDIGAAEGNFSIDIIEKAKKVYLFEADPLWLKALQATFNPWKEKVEIIPKMVAAVTSNHTVSLDDFFREREPFDFIKIDVEGAEKQILDGMKQLLENKKIKKVALCTYHRQQDAEYFSRILKEYGYTIRFSKGYMIFRKCIEAPYLRKGVLRATLND